MAKDNPRYQGFLEQMRQFKQEEDIVVPSIDVQRKTAFVLDSIQTIILKKHNTI